MAENKYLRFAVRLGSALLAVAAAWLALRFALPWLLPFILALLTARLMEPAVRFMEERLRFRRGFAAALCTLALTGGLAALLVFSGIRAVEALARLARTLPSLLSGLPAALEAAEARLRGGFGSASPELQKLLDGAISGFSQQLSALPARLSSGLLSFLSDCAARVPDAALFAVAYGVGTFFISSGRPAVTAFLLRQIPEAWQSRVRRLRSDLLGTLGKWARAQLVLMLVTFSELLAAFLLLGVRPVLLPALTIAFIDALPVLGTGVVLLPWAGLMLLAGRYGLAAGLAVTYGVVTLMRSCLEPKVFGARVGLHPAATLLAIYAGWRLMGVGGMLLFPFILVLLKQLNDREYIKLWK